MSSPNQASTPITGSNYRDGSPNSGAVAVDEATVAAPCSAGIDSSGQEGQMSSRRTADGPSQSPSSADFLTSSACVRKASIEYVVSVIFMFYILGYHGFFGLAQVSSTHFERLKENVHEPWLVFAWLGSKGVDVTDPQWYQFMVGLPLAFPLLIGFLVLSRQARRRCRLIQRGTAQEGSKSDALTSPVEDGAATAASADEGIPVHRNMTPVHLFHAVFGIIMALGVTGPGALFGLILVLLNYRFLSTLHRVCPSFKLRLAVMWFVQVVVLFVNAKAGGYRFSWFGFGFLDSAWPALLPWTVHYNMSLLRMIAFNSDRWEASSCSPGIFQKILNKHDTSCLDCAVIRDANSGPARGNHRPTNGESLRCYKCRTDCPRATWEYNLVSYLGYVYYPPLFIAGPMISFNAYASFLSNPSRGITVRSMLRYGLRVLCNAILFCTVMHFTYIMAILLTPAVSATSAASGVHDVQVTTLSVFDSISLNQRALLVFLTLAFLWMKFNFIWKFFRLFAMADGVDAPEDMRRCFADTVSIQDFWRDWHASFNLWIVRYMYVPMGGSSSKFLSIFPIFFFIAIWHDIELRLLYWAMVICIFFVPETIVLMFVASRNPLIQRLKRRPLLWRFVRIAGAGSGEIILTTANLIGFSVSSSGAKDSVGQAIFAVPWSFYMITIVFFLCCGTISIQNRDRAAFDEWQLRLKFNMPVQTSRKK